MEGNDVLPLEPKLSLHGDLRERKEIRIRRLETLIFIVVSHALLGGRACFTATSYAVSANYPQRLSMWEQQQQLYGGEKRLNTLITDK